MEVEIKVILGEVEVRKNILFPSVSSDVTQTGKKQRTGVSSVKISAQEVNRKWFNMKLNAKKKQQLAFTEKLNYS